MKNLYGKGKVKVQVVQVHPSSCRDAYSVLRMLPMAIATLSAALPPEDQEVLAYLIARAPDGLPLEDETKKNKRAPPGRKSNGNGNEGTPPWGGGGGRGATASSSSSSSPFARFAEADALLRRSPSNGRAGAATPPNKDVKSKRKSAAAAAQQQQQVLRSHGPSFECSCFQCYTSYWSRWDASPSREIIHQAIDLFEEHMAAVAAEAEAEASAKANSKGKNRKGSKEGKNGHNKQRAEENNNLKPQEVKENGRVAVPDEMEGKIEGNVVVRSEREEDSKLAPKSKKIVPFDFGEDEDVERGAKKASEHEQQQQEARAGACPLGSRSLMRRMFPDMMSFVADHLWTAWSSPARATNT